MNFNWSYALKKYSTKIQDVYVIFFARPFFKRFNLILFHTALRGLGINNVTRGVPFFSPDYFSGEIDLIKKIIIKFDEKKFLYLDIGGNDGSHLKKIICDTKNIKVKIFEPSINNLKKIKKNLNLYSKRIQCFNFKLGNKKGIEKLYDYKHSGSIHATSYKKIIQNSLRKKVITYKTKVQKIDYLKFPEKIKIIKIDVEGDELKVLKGGIKTIIKDNPIIILEFNSCHIFSKTFLRDIMNILYLYNVYRILPGGKIITINKDYDSILFELFAYQNLLFYPKKDKLILDYIIK
jgi:FkbM family methyltransferase